MNNKMKEGYIKPEQRKKILLITDDIRVHSGVAQIGREMILNTCHHYNWTQIAGAVDHPDKGKQIIMNDEVNKQTGMKDASLSLYPAQGYGDINLLRSK